jgi:hypothetical protein
MSFIILVELVTNCQRYIYIYIYWTPLKQRASQNLSFHQKLPSLNMSYWPAYETKRSHKFVSRNQMNMLSGLALKTETALQTAP